MTVCARVTPDTPSAGHSSSSSGHLHQMQGATPIVTSRLILRPPGAEDAGPIFRRFAADSEVTHFVGWPRHTSIDDTISFLDFSSSEWRRWPAGPLLIESRTDRTLLGSTGLAFETPDRASTGYVLARDARGLGYATEALAAVVVLAQDLAVTRLYALCHPANLPSIRVLERCGFSRADILAKHLVFPNLGDNEPKAVACYVHASMNRRSGQHLEWP
jgi:[ribosomal protein S5]-alanine N-acetyltransferase